MFNETAKRVAIVDLVKNKIIKVSEQAAKGFVRTARFDWPEDVNLEVGATQEQIDALDDAAAFNKGEVAVLAAGTDLTNEVKKQAEQAKQEAIEEAKETESAKKYPDPKRIVLENLTIRDLQILAFENEFNLEGATLKGDIIKSIKRQIAQARNPDHVAATSIDNGTNELNEDDELNEEEE